MAAGDYFIQKVVNAYEFATGKHARCVSVEKINASEFGEVQDTPTENTLLGRLKAVETALALLPTDNTGDTTVLTATIANGGSLSSEVDLAGYRNIAIELPSPWTGATITFQAASVTGGTFKNVYDSAGNELSFTIAGNRIIVDVAKLIPLRFIKIRAGSAASPAGQNEARAIKVICKA